MTYKGHIKNGVVVLDEPVELPEGTEVSVKPVKGPKTTGRKRKLPTLAERLAPFIGKLDHLPEDFSVNHDHYLYGAPKRE